MTYWRMQLHPSASGESVAHCVNSLAAGFIGLDFKGNINDLRERSKDSLPPNQKDYWAFAHEMSKGDQVLIIAHHFPFALVTVKGPYNFVRQAVPELGVWFRHFRRVVDVRYYADHVTDVRKWEQIKMTDTISPLRDTNSKSYRLIHSWRA